MNLVRWSIVVLLALLLIVPTAVPAAAVDVNVTLVAASFAFHLGTASGATAPTIEANTGDVVRLRVENTDQATHTFTVPHFSVNENLAVGAVIFVNITTSAADAGTWQFWCEPHSSGSTPETHAGMIGAIQVNAPPPPRTPGFDLVVTLLAATAAFGFLAIRRARRNP